MTAKRYVWRGEDDRSRLDVAYVQFRSRGLQAHGTSITEQYALSWVLDVGPGWLTQSLRVDVSSIDVCRSLELMRDGDGQWRFTLESSDGSDGSHGSVRRESGVPDTRGARSDLPTRGALDCDLGLCPVTNVMPIRRLDLHREDRDEVSLPVVWVEVPSLRVVPTEQFYSSRQFYRSRSDGERRLVGYASAGHRFTAELSVDSDGMVIDYPGLARRVDIQP